MRLSWDDPNARYYETGIDRGVLYVPGLDPVVFNGITGFEESGNGTSSVLYRDGMIYLADMDATDFAGRLSAIFYPDEFSRCVGIPEAVDGFYVDNQKPKRFNFCYRSLIGSGTDGDMFGYQIHLVYNAMAAINTKTRKTIGQQVDNTDFSFDIVCTPVKLTGFRPTAHFIIDTRHLDPGTVSELEDMLYGTSSTTGALPDPNVLFELLNFGDSILVTAHPDGWVTIEGSFANVHNVDYETAEIKNVNATTAGDGTISISDGGDTTVVIE